MCDLFVFHSIPSRRRPLNSMNFLSISFFLCFLIRRKTVSKRQFEQEIALLTALNSNICRASSLGSLLFHFSSANNSTKVESAVKFRNFRQLA